MEPRLMLPKEPLLREADEQRPLAWAEDRTPTKLGLVAHERGGQVLFGSAPADLTARAWTCEYVAGNVVLYPEDDLLDVTTLFAAADVASVSLAFTQSNWPCVAYVAGGAARLWFFNTTAEEYETLDLPGARTPILVTDDHRRAATLFNRNDALLFYIGGEGLCMRRQRDRYGVEIVAADGVSGEIVRAGLNTHFELQIEVD